MPTNKITKKIFVVGCPRSGTTLLQNLLLNISGSFSMPETNFFLLLASNNYIAPRSLPPFGKFEYPKMVDYALCDKIIGSFKKNADLKINAGLELDLKNKSKAGKLEIKYFFEVLMNGYAELGQDILVEKTPIHIFHISIIKSLFPGAIIIGIIRDPRDTFASFNKMLVLQGKSARSIREFSRLWNKAAENILKENIDFVRYEDLIKNPLSEINKIINKYGMNIAALDKNNYADIVRGNEIWKKNVKSAVLADNSKKYQNNLKEKEITEVEKLCGENMEKFGYKKEGVKRSTIFAAKDYFRWNLIKAKIFKNILAQSIKEKI
jgi:hypothetical protein